MVIPHATNHPPKDIISRRRFVSGSLAAAGALSTCSWRVDGAQPAARAKLPVAGVTTVYYDNSHADVILGKILEGFAHDGGAGPDLRLVSLYTDQRPENDLSRGLAQKHGFRLADTIDEAVTLGTGRLAVAGVVIVGEHGHYPETSDTRQIMYPRRRFFDETVASFRRVKQVAPVFSDKHLGYSWADAQHIYDTARALSIPLMAGSSLPVTWRTPSVAPRLGCEFDEVLALGYGPLEGYAFHALEMSQCMAERRQGGETGVASVETVQGPAIWEAQRAGLWSRALFDAALARVPPYGQGKPEELMNADAAFYLIKYRDGLKATLAMANGVTDQFVFSAAVKGASEPLVIWFRTQDVEPFGHFAYLLRAIDDMVHSGRPSYPVERTLLTTGVLDAALHSLAAGHKPLPTPQLDVRYAPVDWPFAPGTP
ncbi:MAG TPA: hypothetical protein VMV69_17270 [Pirellulales bacterium]|nr:hypothetical protein [Pirellulales bacterium]